MFQFDTAVIFERIGGPAALRRALTEDNGYAPAEATVAMWKSRNRIAQAWIGACVYALVQRHPRLTLRELLTVDDEVDNPF